jgi:hypothetical protein
MRVSVLSLFLLSSFAIVASNAAAQASGSVRGLARDSSGNAVAGVVINGRRGVPSARTNDSGAYRLDGLPLGRNVLTAHRLGFAPETLAVVVRAGSVASADFSLHVAAAILDASTVEADPTRGKMGPFNQRKSRGVGSFITRADIEHRQAGSVSELLRYLPGVGVQQRMAGEPQPVRMNRSTNTTTGECKVLVYVDGHPYPNGNVDDFNPLGLEGIEVYRSASEIPADFRTRDATCGVIALWTRDPEAARRNP